MLRVINRTGGNYEKKVLGLAVVTMLMAVGICGRRKALESTANGDILHAKDSVEEEVGAIVNESESETEEDMQEINSIIGTGDYVIRIQAQMPEVPQDVKTIVLGENETLTKEVLTEFLGSETGNIKDLSEEAQREIEQSNAENGQGEERAIFSAFGNAPVYQLFDGQKTAGFSNGTGAYYQDELLYEKCASIYKSADETVLEEADSENIYMETVILL